MKKRLQHYAAIVIGLLSILSFGCSSQKQKSESVLGKIELIPLDSVLLSNDSVAFDFYNIRNVDIGTVEAFSYPLFDLTEIDLNNGQFKKITEKGDGPGEISNFVECVRNKDGYLFILQQNYPSRLIVLDSLNNFVKEINLKDVLGDYYAPPLNSFFQIRSENELECSFFFGINSTLYSTSNKHFYEGSSIFELTLSKDDFKVTNGRLLNKYNDYDVLNNNLDENKKIWTTPLAYFSVKSDEILAVYDFEDALYYYDLDWNTKKKVLLNLDYSSYGFYTEFKDIYDPHLAIVAERRWNFSNRKVLYLHSNARFIFITYQKPISFEQLDEFKMNQSPKGNVLHVYDQQQDEQYSLELPKWVRGHVVHSTESNQVYLLTIHEDLIGKQYYLTRFKFNLIEITL